MRAKHDISHFGKFPKHSLLTPTPPPSHHVCTNFNQNSIIFLSCGRILHFTCQQTLVEWQKRYIIEKATGNNKYNDETWKQLSGFQF